ncbi:MAG: TolC family protein [Tannerella sp.]|jgi:NodT family efflux transporter outer membrane factor (OMF) lipoprotein|nr:TolC family protein [Tannerella sp.]
MKTKIIVKILLIIQIIVQTGCASQKITQTEQIYLPDNYIVASDSTTIAAIRWMDFFSDTHLQEYIRTALNNNYSYTVALERVNQARLVLLQSKMAYLPQLDAGVSAGIQRFGEYHMDGIGNRESSTPIPDPYRDFNLGLRFGWELNVAGKLKHQKRAALARYMASEEALNYTRSLLVCEVATIYYELIGLDKRQTIYSRYIESLNASLSLSRELVAEGFETSLAAEQFETKILSLQSIILWEKHEISVKERALAVLLGGLPIEFVRMDFEQANVLNYPVQTGLPAQIIRYRPDIREAELQLQASKLDVAVAHAAFFPSIVIGGGGEFNSFELSKWFKTPASFVYDIAAGLTAPIFRQREIRTLWENAKSEQRIALKNYHQQVISAYAEVLDVLSEIKTTESMQQLKYKEVAIYHRSQESATELFKLDFAGYLEVLSVMEKSLEAELEYAHISTSHAITHILLYRSLGGG